MIALIQRVSQAQVAVEEVRIASIGVGLLALTGVLRDDSEKDADRLLERMLGYRIFEDPEGRMNLSVEEVQGELLLVPQFTLAANTKKGMRPGFGSAASPDHAKKLFDYLARQAEGSNVQTRTGQFGANMQVSLVNDGPVTFWLQT